VPKQFCHIAFTFNIFVLQPKQNIESERKIANLLDFVAHDIAFHQFNG